MKRLLPRYPSVPVVLIGCIVRDLAFRGAGLGSMLLYDAISRVAKAPIGAYAICADAINEDATAFYTLLHEAPVSTAGESSADAVPADEDSPGADQHLGPSALALAVDQRVRIKGKVGFHRSESASGG